MNYTDLRGKDVYVTMPSTAPARSSVPFHSSGTQPGLRGADQRSSLQSEAGRRCALQQSTGVEVAQPGACPNCWECLQLMRTILPAAVAPAIVSLWLNTKPL